MRRRLRSWRPALRIARRDATRARGRSALVLVMIGLPVLAIGLVIGLPLLTAGIVGATTRSRLPMVSRLA